MFKKLISVAVVLVALAAILSVLNPAPAEAADPTGTPFYEKVFITNLQARLAIAEAWIAGVDTNSVTAIAATNRIALLEAVTSTWNTASTLAISATNRAAALEAYTNVLTAKFAAGIDGYVTNSLSVTNLMIFVDGIVTNNAVTAPE